MDAFEFLETLSSGTLARLYEDPWACQAVFQALPALAQQFVMRLLTCETAIPLQTLEQWLHALPFTGGSDVNGDAALTSASPSIHPVHKMPPVYYHALQKLTRLRVFATVGKDTYQLNPVFQKQLRFALGNIGGSPWEAGRARLPKEVETFTAMDLERYARSRWDSVLHFMVGSTAVQEPHRQVVDILVDTKLMHQNPETRALHITDTGYEFMLKDIHMQMWIFMLEYIRTLDNTKTLRQEDILQFLFQISYCQTNQYYAVADLTETQQLLLADFTNFGLLYRQRLNSDRFYTTSLAVNLVFGGSRGQQRSSLAVMRPGRQLDGLSSSPDLGTELQVVVETNFKIYAYSTSTLHIAMLSVFVDIVARLPNLAIGFITRESLRSALIHGISAQQIYDFLMKHAHPRMRKNNPVIPENIADQIYLWERERNRVQFMEGALFDGFNTKDEFEQVLTYARDLNVLTWSDPIHFKLSIASSGIDNVRHFIQHNLRAA
ncbi:hypothetical protein Poli38472_010912 [Pythium oligandrum]|uniref:General transcription factor IIH subunit 4 n=1 Tax=Pythium oligandrum TaxID=41045 RepID=A0A8K1CF22_PYTOL|nr:hypothetical protein Poli38472_010912 [Pythium oligandrum]|eukprot:TMW61849.1 hypothetical protein Poli38472_010912 [Pythium oligandrum]